MVFANRDFPIETLNPGSNLTFRSLIFMVLNSLAPDFSLFNTHKQLITLSEQRGRNVVLQFFPLAFTSTCTVQLCKMRDDLEIYNRLNATVYGISVDSLHVLRKFREELGLQYELLSDFNKVASADYGALYETFSYHMKGVSKRASFVIDRNGILRFSEVLENASDLPDFGKISETLQQLP